MKKVLFCNEKHGIRIFDISTPELRNKAYLLLFEERRKENYYYGLVRVESNLYKRAKEGDAKAACGVLKIRNDYEYERVEEVDVE